MISKSGFFVLFFVCVDNSVDLLTHLFLVPR